MNAYEQAAARIDATPELEPYRDAILYGWHKGDAHYEWVATCELAELLSWAQAVAPEAVPAEPRCRSSRGRRGIACWPTSPRGRAACTQANGRRAVSADTDGSLPREPVHMPPLTGEAVFAGRRSQTPTPAACCACP